MLGMTLGRCLTLAGGLTGLAQCTPKFVENDTTGGEATLSSTDASESSAPSTVASESSAPTTDASESSAPTTDASTDPTGTLEPVCGDGKLEGDEACDDGNAMDGDGCEAACVPTRQILALTLGSHCSCVLWEDHAFRCWGSAEHRCTGWGDAKITNIGANETPADVGDVPFSGEAAVLALGTHSCLVTTNGAVRCWGRNDDGELGLGTLFEAPTGAEAAEDLDLGVDVAAVDVGGAQTCVRTVDATVRCWGANSRGELGLGHTMPIGDDEPAADSQDVALGGPVVEISAGQDHTCALLDSGDVRCWGAGSPADSLGGMLGLGHNEHIGDDELPDSVDPVDLPGPAVRVMAAGWQTCAVLQDGTLVCWGENIYGQLGLGHKDNIGDDETPNPAGIVDLPAPVVDLAMYATGMCVLLANQELRCWGSGSAGAHGYGHTMNLGDDELPADLPPLDPGGGEVVDIAAGGAHVCARKASGALRCWGYNSRGQLGRGHTMNLGDDELLSTIGNVPYE